MVDDETKDLVEGYLEMRIHSKTQNLEEVLFCVMTEVKELKKLVDKLTDTLAGMVALIKLK